MQPADIRQARDLLERAGLVAVVAHVRPDGDAIGSMLALTLSLRMAGTQARSVLAGGLPARYRFLPGADSVQGGFPEGEFALVTVDAADPDRLGLPLPPGREVDLNLDHHPTNTHYARINLVDERAAATTELILDLAPELGLPIDAQVAACLLTGLVTDTLGFRTPSVRPETLRQAARLMETGADLSSLYAHAMVYRSFVATQYWGRGLARLERQAGLVWASLSLEDRRQVGYPGADDADLIDILASIQEADIALVFVEQQEGEVKVSWRARRGYDVAALAGQFGGGGHTLAAGAQVRGALEPVMQRVLAATRAVLTVGPEES